MAKKFDGIIEAVRYTPNGKIDCVRAYELRVVAYSDRIILDRETLIKRLKNGKKFAVGQRKEYWGGTFDIKKTVKLASKNGQEYLTTRDQAVDRDELEDAPAF
ncbi:MAG: hypothetical protein Kow002_04330 [Anaerolineales bacterium]